MGCDIHGAVEYRNPKGSDYEQRWQQLIGQPDMGRYYRLFGRLAGVRGEGPPVADPRGFPVDASHETREAFMHWIAYGREPSSNEVSPADAKGYHDRYGAAYWGEYRPQGYHSSTLVQDVLSGETLHSSSEYHFKGAEHDGAPLMVQNPDWHTPSWVTTAEFAAALDGLERVVEYRALLAAMREVESMGWEARLVFWFDN